MFFFVLVTPFFVNRGSEKLPTLLGELALVAKGPRFRESGHYRGSASIAGQGWGATGETLTKNKQCILPMFALRPWLL